MIKYKQIVCLLAMI